MGRWFLREKHNVEPDTTSWFSPVRQVVNSAQPGRAGRAKAGWRMRGICLKKKNSLWGLWGGPASHSLAIIDKHTRRGRIRSPLCVCRSEDNGHICLVIRRRSVCLRRGSSRHEEPRVWYPAEWESQALLVLFSLRPDELPVQYHFLKTSHIMYTKFCWDEAQL